MCDATRRQNCGPLGGKQVPASLQATDSFCRELAGFNLGREKLANFAVFLPDVPPELWLSEVEDWQTFEDWLVTWVASGGEESLR